MRRPVRFALRFMMVLAAGASLPLLLRATSTGCPYLSALSDWAVGEVLASSTC